jgi:hypothetical protein
MLYHVMLCHVICMDISWFYTVLEPFNEVLNTSAHKRSLKLLHLIRHALQHHYLLHHYHSLLATHHSFVITHHLPLTTHYPPLITHHSPLFTHPLPIRSIESDMNVFQGLVSNPIFVGILLFTVMAQYGLVEFGGAFVRTVCAHTHIHTYTYMHTYIHTCMYTCKCFTSYTFLFLFRLCLSVFTVIQYILLFNLIYCH